MNGNNYGCNDQATPRRVVALVCQRAHQRRRQGLGSGQACRRRVSAGGGVVHVGGGFQGGGGLHNSQTTLVADGAVIAADATASGHGGDVVVWSDGATSYNGTITARGGSVAGNGGRVEVSGKGNLEFLGSVDAGAAHGQGGSLLLDPTNITVGASEASQVVRVLRTGTSVSLQASQDIAVNSLIDGRGGRTGGGLSLSAGNNLALNDSIVTNGGAIHLSATNGTVTTAAGKGLFSLGGAVTVAGKSGVVLGDVSSGGSAVSVASSSGNVALNGDVLSNNGGVTVNSGGALTLASGKGIYAGNGAIGLTAASQTLDGYLVSTGTTTLTSSSTAIDLNSAISSTNGNLTIQSAGAVNINAPVLNGASGANLSVSAAGPVTVGAQIDGRGGAMGGAVSLSSSNGSIALNENIVTNAGTIDLNAANGTLTSAAGQGLYSGGSAITVAGKSGVTLGDVSAGSGSISVASSAGNIALNGDLVTSGSGAVSVTANAGSISSAAGKGIYSASGGITESAGTLTSGILSSGAGNITLTAGSGGATLADDIVTTGGSVSVNSGGALALTATKGIYSGSGAIALTGASETIDGYLVSTGATTLTSTSGAVNLNSDINTTNGNLTVGSAGAVTLAGNIVNGFSGHNLDVTAVGTITVNGQIDGRNGSSGGTVTLASSGGDVALNQSIVTNHGAIAVTASNGAVSTAPAIGLFSAGADITVAGKSGVTAGDMDAGGGSVAIASTAGNVKLDGDLVTSGSGAVNVTANAGSISSAAGKGIYSAGGDIVLMAGTTGTATSLEAGILSSSGGNIALTSGTGGMTLAGEISTDGGTLTANSGGNIDASSGGGIFAGAGSVSLTGRAGVSTGEVDARGTVTVTAVAGPARLGGDVSADHGITVTSSGDVTVNGMLATVNSPITVTSTAGAITTSSSTPDTTGFFVGDGVPVSGIQGLGSGAITLNAPNAIDTWEIATAGTISATSTTGTIHVNRTPDIRNTGMTLSAGETVDLGSGVAGRSLYSDGNIDITVGAPGLLLDTQRVISMAGDITVKAVGSITGGSYSANPYFDAVGQLAGGGNVTLHSGAGSIDGPQINASSTVNLYAFGDIGDTARTGYVSLFGPGGSAESATLESLNGDITFRVQTGATGSLTATAHNGNITQEGFPSGSVPVLGQLVQLWAKNDITLDAAKAGTVTLTAGRDIVFSDNGSSALPLSSPPKSSFSLDSTRLTAGRNISMASSMDVTQNLQISAPTGSVNISGWLQLLGSNVKAIALDIGANDIVIGGRINVDGGLKANATGLVSVSGDVKVSSTIDVSGGSIAFSGPVDAHGAFTTRSSGTTTVDGQLTTHGAASSVDIQANKIVLGGTIQTELATISLTGPIQVSPFAGNQVLLATSPLETDIHGNPWPGADINLNGKVSLAPSYADHALLLLWGGATGSINFGGDVLGVIPQNPAQTLSRSLQLAAYAGQMTQTSGSNVINPNQAYFYHQTGAMPDCVACGSEPAGWYSVARSAVPGDPLTFTPGAIAPVKVTEIGYGAGIPTSTPPTPQAPSTVIPILMPPLPLAVLISPQVVGGVQPQIEPPAPISALSIAPAALVEIPVSLPSLSAATVSANISAPASPPDSPLLAAGAVVANTGLPGNASGSVTSPGQVSGDAPSANLTPPEQSIAIAPQIDTSAAIRAAELANTTETVGTTGSDAGTGTGSVGATTDVSVRDPGIVLALSGGRGPAREVDLGRGSSTGPSVDLLSVLGNGDDCEIARTCHGRKY